MAQADEERVPRLAASQPLQESVGYHGRAPMGRGVAPGYGGGGGGSSMDVETQRYVDKSVEVVRAQNDARFAETMARLDKLNPMTVWQYVVATLTVIVAVAGLAYSVFLGMGASFDSGFATSAAFEETARRIAEEQSERDAAQDARLDAVIDALNQNNDSLQTLIDRQSE